ncbi:MAG: VCBS repeat-containing protein, partial [Chloroflexota bacterium]
IQTLVADPNRDGRDDLVVVRRTGEDSITIVVYRGWTTGTSFARLYFTSVLPVSFAGTRFSAADMTGDGRSDLFALVDRGVDGDGLPLGTTVMRFDSTGTTFRQRTWFSSSTMAWETAFPY